MLNLAVAALALHLSYAPVPFSGVPHCRCADILLEMDHDLHLVDQDALDLRHCLTRAHSTCPPAELIDMMSLYVEGDQHAATALHCMRFLSNPP